MEDTDPASRTADVRTKGVRPARSVAGIDVSHGEAGWAGWARTGRGSGATMRRMLGVVVVVLGLLAPTVAGAKDVPNTTCRMDGLATQAAMTATVTCLNLDPQTHGEFDGRVTVTLQARAGDAWTDLAEATCTGRSVNGVLELPCAAATTDPDGSRAVRGLIDLDAPKDWEPSVAEPAYHGGRPIRDPLALDHCDVNEAVDSDLTAQPPPWADLCAVTMETAVDDDGALASVAVVVHVAGELEQRTPTSTWRTTLDMGDDCVHELLVADDAALGEVGLTARTLCEFTPGTCGPIFTLVAELTGGVCAASGTFATEDVQELPADAVTFDHSELRITLRPGDASGRLGAALTLGSTVASAHAFATTGVATPGGERAVVDGDHAASTGRSYTIGN
jgi:hypothetical protein